MRPTDGHFRDPNEVTDACGSLGTATYDGRNILKGKVLDEPRRRA